MPNSANGVFPGKDSTSNGNGKGLVLIVEDDDMNRKLFRDSIDGSGYRTIYAFGGIEAVEMARRHRPDIILMDIKLPDIPGTEVARLLKSTPDLSHIPVIAITAFASNGDREIITASGCDVYMAKPVSVSEMLGAIERCITHENDGKSS